MLFLNALFLATAASAGRFHSRQNNNNNNNNNNNAAVQRGGDTQVFFEEGGVPGNECLTFRNNGRFFTSDLDVFFFFFGEVCCL